jgi:hypothetical protein
MITEKTTAAEKEALIADYDDRVASYESQFHAYRTWLEDDGRAGSILVASIEDHFFADIVELERSHQMWIFLRSRYEPTGQSTFFVVIRQEQLLSLMIPLMLSSISSLVFDVRLTLLVHSCLLPLVSHARIRRLLLSFVACMTS